jgi:hypothetical protein
MSGDETAVACVPDAIPASRREQYAQLREVLFLPGQEIRELVDGYSFRLPDGDAAVMQTAEFITLERLCCPFFTFRLEVSASEAWLALTGGQQVKAFLRAELGYE